MEPIEQLKRTLLQISMLLVFFIPFAIAFQLMLFAQVTTYHGVIKCNTILRIK